MLLADTSFINNVANETGWHYYCGFSEFVLFRFLATNSLFIQDQAFTHKIQISLLGSLFLRKMSLFPFWSYKTLRHYLISGLMYP